MPKWTGYVFATFATAALYSEAAADVEIAWEADGFEAPESAVFDSEANAIYVSNMKGEGTAKDGDGYISKLSLEGEVVDKDWATGLDAPKGMAVQNGMLYVADIGRLVVIDTASGETVASHEVPDSGLLNDVTAHADGRIFVSDMIANRIHVLEDDSFDIWLEDDALENPNGLLAEDDRLMVGAWGVMKPDFSTEIAGHVKAIDYASKEITSLGDGGPVGNLDGVEADGRGGYLLTDWMEGSLLHFGGDGSSTLLSLIHI